MKFKKSWILQVIGILIFILILFRIDLKSTFAILKNTNLIYFISAQLLSFVFLLPKSWRWQYLLEKQGIRVFKWREVLLIYTATFYLSLLTPAKVGDFSKIFYLTAKGYSLGKSLVTILLDRIADVLLVGIIAFWGLIFWLSIITPYQALIVVLGFIFIFLLVVVCLKFPYFPRKAFSLMIPKKWQEDVKMNFNQFTGDFKKFNIRTYIFTAVTTLICWLVYYFQIYLLALSLDIQITFLYIVILASILSVSSLIPISPGGTNIGTRDAILVFAFLTLGIASRESAIALSLLILSLIVVQGLIGMIAWFKMPIPLKTAEGKSNG